MTGRAAVLSPRANVDARRLSARAASMPLGAFVASRALVLVAGCAGALAVPRRRSWQIFDPTQVSSHLGSIGDAVGATAVRWDAIHYLQLATGGYRNVTNTAFYPLYPLLVRGLGWVLGSDVLAGIAISLVAFAVALGLLAALTELELGARAARAAVLLVAFAPLSFFFSAVYTEALFVALSLGAMYAARTNRWRLALVLGALSAVTRVTGMLIVIPLAVLRVGQRPREARRSGAIALARCVVPLAAVPSTLLAYLGFLMLRGYGTLTPFTEQTSYGRHTSGSLGAIVMAVRAAAAGLRWLIDGSPLLAPTLGGPFSAGTQNLVLLLVLVTAIVALALVYRRLPAAYAAYATAALIICTWDPINGLPLRSFDRFTLTIFPLWMAAGAWLAEHRRARLAVYAASVALLAFYSFQFATWAFIA